MRRESLPLLLGISPLRIASLKFRDLAVRLFFSVRDDSSNACLKFLHRNEFDINWLLFFHL